MNIEYSKLLESFEKLSLLVESNIKPKEQYNSDNLTEIATALAKAQGEFKPVMFNQENPYFKSRFADLDIIIKSVRPALSKYGLSFIQQQRMTNEGMTVLHSIILHSSGQWIESRSRIVPPKNDMHSFASTLSYMKRHAAMSLLGITASDDVVDDDAEVAMVQTREMFAKGTAINSKYNPKDENFDTITKEQMEELNYELTEYPDIAEQVLEGLKIQSLADMPKTKYSVSMKRIRDIKNMRNGIK